MNLKELYNDGIVSVTRTMFRVGSTQFPIRNISSIQVLVEYPKRGGPAFFIISGCIICFFALTTRSPSEAFPIGLVCIVIGILWWKLQKNTYYIEVDSGGSKSRVYSSNDAVKIAAINVAIDSALELH